MELWRVPLFSGQSYAISGTQLDEFEISLICEEMYGRLRYDAKLLESLEEFKETVHDLFLLGPSFVGIKDGVPVMIAGVAVYETSGYAWVYGTNDIENSPVWFCRTLKREYDIALYHLKDKGINTVFALVYAEDSRYLNFTRLFGFNEIAESTIDDQPVIVYMRAL